MGLFRAIGLDSRQLYHMIGFENGFQTLGSFAASIVGGLIIGKAICSAVGNVPGFSFVGYTFPAVLQKKQRSRAASCDRIEVVNYDMAL